MTKNRIERFFCRRLKKARSRESTYEIFFFFFRLLAPSKSIFSHEDRVAVKIGNKIEDGSKRKFRPFWSQMTFFRLEEFQRGTIEFEGASTRIDGKTSQKKIRAYKVRMKIPGRKP